MHDIVRRLDDLLPYLQVSAGVPAEPGWVNLAEALEDFRRGQARSVLDGRVAVDEGQAEPLRKAAAHRRLARPHEADEDDWAIETLGEFMHARGYTALAKVGKSPI